MKKRFYLYWLAGCFLLYPSSELIAAEQPGAQKPDALAQISTEDQKVIALLELLQKMDMLKDLDLMTAGKEKQ